MLKFNFNKIVNLIYVYILIFYVLIIELYWWYVINFALIRVYYIYLGLGGGGWGLDIRVFGYFDVVFFVFVL